eukprot:TRINITY_DN9892_c0_g2_i4.p1 TRINITY_DN9892_c0_g2~~TRINITY_DN9892_c0_g2_i4.p1  ORF type:complete len:1049 (+),score=214.03 TRINITY_DN9892_c0_g2_i4:83-3148(+)
MADWVAIAAVSILVNIVGLLIIVVIVYVSGQDVVTVLPRIADTVSAWFSRTVRLERLLQRKSHLEEQVIIELINLNDNKTSKNLTVAEALMVLNPRPPFIPRWSSKSTLRISDTLDRAIKQFARAHLRRRILRLTLPGSNFSNYARRRFFLIGTITLMVALMAQLYTLPNVSEIVLQFIQDHLITLLGFVLLHFLGAILLVLAIFIKTNRRPLFAAITTFCPISVLALLHVHPHHGYIVLWIASAVTLLRAVYGWTKLRGDRAPVKATVVPKQTQFLVHGDEYFKALSLALRQAKERVFISGWWLAADLHLRDGREDDTLISLLKEIRAATPKLKIYVIVYNEPLLAPMRVGSAFVMQRLEAKAVDAKVLRLPARITSGSLSNTLWSNHRKAVVVDAGTQDVMAFVGGIDLCFGRYDTCSHELFDYQRPYNWVGVDYWCPHDSPPSDESLNDASTDIVDRRLVQRMPWHDVQVQLFGQIAHEVGVSFAEMWNSCSIRNQVLGWPELRFARVDWSRVVPHSTSSTKKSRLLQSLPTWGSGNELHKHEIMNAYIQMINTAKEYVYIETQFFVTWCGWQWGERHVGNPIGLALVQRIWSAMLSDIAAGSKGHPRVASFFVSVVLPLLPEGMLEEDSVQAVMHFQYASTCRGRESLLGQLEHQLHHYEHKHGPTNLKPGDYLRFFALQKVQVDPLPHWNSVATRRSKSVTAAVRFATMAAGQRLKSALNTPAEAFPMLSRPTSAPAVVISTTPAEAPATATEGPATAPASATESPATATASPATATESPAMAAESPETLTAGDLAEQPSAKVPRGKRGARRKAKKHVNEPPQMMQQESATPIAAMPDLSMSDSTTCRVAVSMIYVHSKLMIVDDDAVIIGSANMNDRSMMGNRDAEIAVELHDIPQIKALREKLWAEFTGLAETDAVLQNPRVAFEFMTKLSKENARRINVIHPGTPSNPSLITLAAYRQMVASSAKQTLSELVHEAPQGYVVPYPKHFLEGERLWHQSSMSEQFSAFVPPYAYT